MDAVLCLITAIWTSYYLSTPVKTPYADMQMQDRQCAIERRSLPKPCVVEFQNLMSPYQTALSKYVLFYLMVAW
jgi:hypothetical protein